MSAWKLLGAVYPSSRDLLRRGSATSTMCMLVDDHEEREGGEEASAGSALLLQLHFTPFRRARCSLLEGCCTYIGGVRVAASGLASSWMPASTRTFLRAPSSRVTLCATMWWLGLIGSDSGSCFASVSVSGSCSSSG